MVNPPDPTFPGRIVPLTLVQSALSNLGGPLSDGDQFVIVDLLLLISIFLNIGISAVILIRPTSPPL